MPPPDLHEIYDAHCQALFGFVLNLTRSESETRDVLQELFLKLAARPDRLAAVREMRGFLIRLAHNLAIDSCRRRLTHDACLQRAALQSPPTLFAPAFDPDELSFRDALDLALAQLPLEQRAVVHLKLWEEMTFAQIASALDISANTAASRYRYGIEKLQGLLRPLYAELLTTQP